MSAKRLTKDALELRDKIYMLVHGLPTDVVMAALALTQAGAVFVNYEKEDRLCVIMGIAEKAAECLEIYENSPLDTS